jgi:sulfur-carrier protein
MDAAPVVLICLPGPLRTYAGGASRLEVAAPTVKAALEHLERSQLDLHRNVCDETGALRRHLNVFVNSENIRHLDGIDTALAAGDVLWILPSVSGG